MRREAGATANAVIRMLLNYRNKVIVAPTGHFGSIVDVISKKASNQIVSELDNRNLVEFWKQVYDIDISPDEIPLLKIKMLNSENTFTYPRACVTSAKNHCIFQLQFRNSSNTNNQDLSQECMKL